MNDLKLDAGLICQTIETLRLRIHDRFPESGLHQVCSNLVDLGRQTQRTIDKIGSPIWPMRSLTVVFLGLMVFGVAWLVLTFPHDETVTLEEVIPFAEATTNLLIFVALALFWIWTSELKMRRARVMRAINRLREIAHVIDMHQLTKDPDAAFQRSRPTEHSPKRRMTPYQLDRYLDYCSEMLSLIAKLGYLYVSEFDDQEASQSAAELESLCSGLSRKIWQKIMVLQNLGIRYPAKLEPQTADISPPSSSTGPGVDTSVEVDQNRS